MPVTYNKKKKSKRLTNSLPAFVNRVLLEGSYVYSSLYCLRWFLGCIEELSSCSNDHRSHMSQKYLPSGLLQKKFANPRSMIRLFLPYYFFQAVLSSNLSNLHSWRLNILWIQIKVQLHLKVALGISFHIRNFKKALDLPTLIVVTYLTTIILSHISLCTLAFKQYSIVLCTD